MLLGMYSGVAGDGSEGGSGGEPGGGSGGREVLSPGNRVFLRETGSFSGMTSLKFSKGVFLREIIKRFKRAIIFQHDLTLYMDNLD